MAVIGNTLRMEIDHRRAEIEVTKLVGGSNAFVRRPFLYTGGLYGLLGGMLAAALVGISCRLLAEPVTRLAQTYGSAFTLATPSLAQIGQLLAVGVGLGLVGAFLSTSRHLARIQPRV